MNRKENKIKLITAQQAMRKVSFIILLLLLTLGFAQKGSAQCAGFIDSLAQFCLSSSSTKLFSNATASGGTINWISSGDGTFDNNTIARPTYTPGIQDSINGYAFIYLDVYVDHPVNYCSVLPYVTLYFNNMQAVATPAAQTTCSGATIVPIITAANLRTPTYTWRRDNQFTVTGMPLSGTGGIRGALTNITTEPVTVTFTITPTTPTCTGTPITATVTVNPRVVATATPLAQTICSGSAITPVNLTSNIAGTTFSWTRDSLTAVSGIAASGTGNITGSLVNNTAAPVTVSFTITPTANGCAGTPVKATVTVNPATVVAAVAPASQSICSGGTITPLLLTSNTAGSSFNWTRDNTAAVTGISETGTGNISGTLTNATTSPVTVNIIATATANGCTSSPVNAMITVGPALLATATPAIQSVCSGAAIVPVILGSNLGGTSFSWTRNNTVAATGIAASGTGNISGILTNTSTQPVTVTFTITPVAQGCTGQAITATVVVNPLPSTTVAGSGQNVCSGAPINTVSFTSATPGAEFNWTRTNTAAITGIPASGSGNISGVLTTTSLSQLVVTFTVRATAAGCTGASVPATIRVIPLPVATATPATQAICSGSNISNIVLTSNLGSTTYAWTRNNTANVAGIAATGSGNISGSLTSSSATRSDVTFMITPRAANCNGPAIPAIVYVDPRPGANITGSQSICVGQPSGNISIALTGEGPWNFTYSDGTTPVSVTANSINPYTFIVNPAVAATYTVTALSTASCTALPAALTGSATLTPLRYDINASAGPNGSISPAGIQSVNCSSSHTYTITPDPGYNVQEVLVNGIPQGSITSYTFTNVSGNQTISASFSSGSNGITASADDNGAIVPSGSVQVGTGGSQMFNFVPNACHEVEDVLVNGVSQGPLNSYTFTNVTAPQSINVQFRNIEYNIVASAGANGSISNVGTTAVNCGSSATYTITPDPGFNVQEVLVNGIPQGSITSYTFTNISGNQTISASFSSGNNIITASADDNGDIIPSGEVQVGTGGSQTFSFVPESCYEVEDVLINGVSQGPLGSYTFTNVMAPQTIHVQFRDIEYPITATAGEHGTISPEGITMVECGHAQTYTILAGESFSVMDVVVNGISMGPITSYTFTNVAAPQTISASFAPFSHIITAGSGGNGSISPSGSVFVADGSSQSFTFTADSCFQIADVLVNGISQGPISAYLFENVVSAQSIQVIFSPLNYSIVATAGSNGAISPAGVTNVACGGSQTYIFTPDAGYGVQDVLVNGISQGAIGAYTFTNVTAAQSISVVFAAGMYSITASSDAGGSISPSGIVQVASGAGATFSIIPAKCYEVADVIVNGKSEGPLTSYSFVNVTQDQTIHATFRLIQYTIAASAGANGTISPAGSTTVACGGTVSYTITPLPGFAISNVLVNGISQGAITSYIFENVSTSQTIDALFVAATTTISATSGANGAISPAGDIIIPIGGNPSFTFTANNCYQVADVLVNGISQGALNSYTFSNVITPQTISVSFVQSSYEIVASAGLNGTITPAGTTSVLCGSNQTYSIVASQGFAVQDVIVDGVGQGPIASYSFTNITAPHTISASFTAVIACTTPSLQANITNVACRNAATGAITLTTTGGTAPFSYSWSGTGGFIANTKDIANLVAGTYTVQVTANGGCFTSATYTITQPATVLTTGSTQGTITCSGGTTTVNITAAGGVAPYTGTGAFTNQLAGVNIYPVTDAAGCTVNRTVTLTQPTPIVASISANAIACSGGTTILRVTATGGTGIRQFSLNGGPFQTMTTFTVNAAGSPYTVTVRDANLCTVVTNTLVVTNPAVSTVPARPAVVTGQVYGLCGGGIFTYTVEPVQNATGYTWQPPAGGTIVSGQGTSTVQVSVPATFTTSSAIGVSAINGCGTSTQYRFSIFAVQYYAPAAINGPTAVTTNQAGVQYSVPSTPGTTYNWTVPFGAAITAGQGTNVVTVRFGSTSGNIGLDVINACGTAPRALKAITVAAPRPGGLAARAAIAPPEAQLNIYPNPAMHNTTVQFNTNKAGSKYEITITSATDKTILTQSGISKTGLNTLQFDLRRLNRGIYMVRLVTDGYSETKKIFKQ